MFFLLSTILSQLWEDNRIETDTTKGVNTDIDRPVGDPGDGPGGPGPAFLFFDQIEDRKAEKRNF